MFKTPEVSGILLLGTAGEIVIDDAHCNDEGADGLYESMCITLRSEYESAFYYLQVLNHESFHALCDILGAQLDLHLEEILANTSSQIAATLGMILAPEELHNGADEKEEDQAGPPEIPNHVNHIGLL